MRQRSIFAVGLITSLSGLAGAAALTGCEDGPSQTFTPAPVNAGNLWNNGDPDAGTGVFDAAAPFDASFGSVNALEHCTADKQRTVWANMLQQPIIPPLQFAGLNLAYDEKFDGITLKEAEAINCTGNSLGAGGVSWGDNGEVLFFYTTSNYVVNQIDLNLGYSGAMTFHQAVGPKGANGQCAIVSRFVKDSPTPGDPDNCTGHTYVLQLGQPILKDGVVLEVDWQDTGANTVVNELFNAMMATYGQGAIGYTTTGDYDTTDCTGDGACLEFGPSAAGGNGGACLFGFIPLSGLLFETNCTVQVQPTISIPTNISQDFYLTEPYSYEASYLSISGQGPVSVPRFNVAADPTHCFFQLGMDWKTYIANCIDVPNGDTTDTAVLDAGLVQLPGAPLTTNEVNENKALSAPTHDLETYSFNVVGPQGQWADEAVIAQPQVVVQDQDRPTINDATQSLLNWWAIGRYDLGTPENDLSAGSYTGKGSSYIYREWGTLLEQDVNRILAAAYPTRVQTSGPNKGQTIYNHFLGDPACFVPVAQANAIGCTGLEGLLLQTTVPTQPDPNPPEGDPADDCATTPTPVCALYGAYLAGGYSGFGVGGYGATVLHAGGLYSVFCQNPPGATYPPGTGTDPLNGSCNINANWPGALAQVQQVVGLGNLNTVPTEIADVRYYYKWYGVATVQYLKAYGTNPNATFADVNAQTIDLESIFFDTFNAGGTFIDNFEYVERSFMQNMPTTYVANAVGTGTGAVTVPAIINAAPEDFSYQSIVLDGDSFGSAWYKYLYRPERAMFQAMLENKGDLPGSENNINITNLAGSALLQADYASYECATQYPVVTIPSTSGGAPITGAWEEICGGSCLGGISNSVPCPTPPLNPPDSSGNRSLQLDLNGQNPGLGLASTNPRLANYKAVWGRGNACPVGSTPSYELNPTSSTLNPYNPNGCSVATFVLPVSTAVGTVFSVGQKPKGNGSGTGYLGRLSYVGTDENTLTAFVNVPDMPNPYNAVTLAGDAAPGNIQVTIPWSPAYDGVGFAVPINATLDKFYQTQQLDFTGVLLSYRLDVVPWADPITQEPDGTLTVEAVEGDDFLGEAFLCQDVGGFPNAGTGDLLGSHMYDSAASVLDWITAHPGSEQTCNIIVRYSVYDNYVDFITSLSAGVQLDINQGGGYGRVVGVIAYDPTLSAAP